MLYVAQVDESGSVVRFLDAKEPSQLWAAINMEIKESASLNKAAPLFAVVECEFTPGQYMSAGGFSYQRKVVGVSHHVDTSVFPGSYRRIDDAARAAFDATVAGVER